MLFLKTGGMNETMNEVKYSFEQLNQRVKKSWDANVLVRAMDLEQATDHSYINLIKPWVMEKVLCGTNEESTILDIGCGCGYLANAVYETGRHRVKGIDISEESVSYAQRKYPMITFQCQDVCTLSEPHKYEMCLAVMVLNNMPDIKRFFSTAHNLLIPGGKIITVIPHPCFWPDHHLCETGYFYSKEIPYDFLFATKGRSDYASNILYFHRTLETYLRCIRETGFILSNLLELADSKDRREPDILCMELSTK